MQRPRSMYLVLCKAGAWLTEKGGQYQRPWGPSLSRISEWYLLEISVFRAFLLLLPLHGRVGLQCSCPEARPGS